MPASFHLSQHSSWLATSFKKALETGGLVQVSREDGTMPLELPQDTNQQSHTYSPSRMVICPLYSNRLGPVRAFLVLALASWRPYDDDYQRFLYTLKDQIGTNQVAAVAHNDEVRKRGISAEQRTSDKANVSLEPETRILGNEEGEKMLARFTARAQVALGILDAKGSVIFANPLWRDLTRLEPADDQVAWAKVQLFYARLLFLYMKVSNSENQHAESSKITY